MKRSFFSNTLCKQERHKRLWSSLFNGRWNDLVPFSHDYKQCLWEKALRYYLCNGVWCHAVTTSTATTNFIGMTTTAISTYIGNQPYCPILQLVIKRVLRKNKIRFTQNCASFLTQREPQLHLFHSHVPHGTKYSNVSFSGRCYLWYRADVLCVEENATNVFSVFCGRENCYFVCEAGDMSWERHCEDMVSDIYEDGCPVNRTPGHLIASDDALINIIT